MLQRSSHTHCCCSKEVCEWSHGAAIVAVVAALTSGQNRCLLMRNCTNAVFYAVKSGSGTSASVLQPLAQTWAKASAEKRLDGAGG